MCLNPLIGAPQEHSADGLEKKIGEPKDEMGSKLGAGFQGLAEQEEAVVNSDEQQSYADADICFTPVHLDTKRNTHERKAEASEGESDLSMHVDADGRGQIRVLFLKFFPDLRGLRGVRDPAQLIGHHL